MDIRSAKGLRWFLSRLRHGGWSGVGCEGLSHYVFWKAIGLKDFLETMQLRFPRCVVADLEGPVSHTPQYSSGCSLVMVRMKGDVSISVRGFSID